MDYVNKFYEWAFGSLGADSIHVMFFILADILLFTFLAGIVVSLAYSYGTKYRAAAKNIIRALNSNCSDGELNVAMEQLPYAPLSAWRQFVKIKRGRLSEFMSGTVCVDNPMKVAWLKVFSKLMYQLSAVCAVFLIGYDMGDQTFRLGAMLFVGGSVLGLILMLSDKAYYNATLMTHDKLIRALDARVGDLSEMEPAQANTKKSETVEQKTPSRQILTTLQEPVTTKETVPIPTHVVANQQESDKVRVGHQAKQEDVQAERAKVASSAQERAAKMSGGANDAKESNVVFSAQTQAVINEIGRLSVFGGTGKELKELAVRLKEERAKPENRTPEKMRKLNETLSLLLKAMSNIR